MTDRTQTTQPDDRCVTLPNGDCVAPWPCMHGPGASSSETNIKAATPTWGAGDVSTDAKHPDQTLQMLVHLCHAKDWELANGDIHEAERLAYYADLVKYIRKEMKP